MAEQSCDELLIDDSFIKAPCCTHTWHFLTLNLQRTDTNALMFQTCLQIGASWQSSRLKKKKKKENLTSRYWQTWPESIDGRKRQKVRLCVCIRPCVWVCMREHTPDFEKCMKNTAFFFFSTQRKRANGSQNARGKHSSNSVRAKGADQRESCLQFRPTRQFFPRLPGERAQREINLRYQFAEFCSIDGWVPRDFTPSAQEPGPVNKIT